MSGKQKRGKIKKQLKKFDLFFYFAFDSQAVNQIFLGRGILLNFFVCMVVQRD